MNITIVTTATPDPEAHAVSFTSMARHLYETNPDYTFNQLVNLDDDLGVRSQLADRINMSIDIMKAAVRPNTILDGRLCQPRLGHKRALTGMLEEAFKTGDMTFILEDDWRFKHDVDLQLLSGVINDMSSMVRFGCHTALGDSEVLGEVVERIGPYVIYMARQPHFSLQGSIIRPREMPIIKKWMVLGAWDPEVENAIGNRVKANGIMSKVIMHQEGHMMIDDVRIHRRVGYNR